MTCDSGRTTQKHHAGERYRHDADARLDQPDEKLIDAAFKELKQISFVFGEVIRQDDRKFLRRATDCTLCLDASANKNVIAFVAACASDDVVETRRGLIGVVNEVGVKGSSGVSADDPADPTWLRLVDEARRKKSLKLSLIHI